MADLQEDERAELMWDERALAAIDGVSDERAQAFHGSLPAAGLPTGTTSHALRHHVTSLLLAAGESVIASLSGSDTRTPRWSSAPTAT